MSEVNAEAVQAALASMYEVVVDRKVIPATRLSIVRQRIENLHELIEQQRHAGYRRQRTVTTVEEVKALPHGSVLRGREGQAYLRLGDRIYGAGNGQAMAVREIEAAGLPATVLFEPEGGTDTDEWSEK
jgi:hypothetical protein